MFEIRKKFTFSASHQLTHLPSDHQCARLHGHNYEVEVVLASEVLNENGFVVDYGDLSLFREYLDTFFEHRHLNAIFKFPTAEVIAQAFYDKCKAWWPQTVEVRVSETPKTWALYRK